MTSQARTLRFAVILSLALQLAACSKTVQWEEEVPLNTGETIWVKRTVQYSMQGDAGNPLDIGLRPKWPEVIEFKWNGKTYRYEGDARIMVLAISPQQQPVLVAGAAAGAWDAKHNYKCVVPFYVQLIPDSTGKNWTWPSQIEPWLYNLPANLLWQRRAPSEMRERYTAAQRHAEDYSALVGSQSQQKINPAYTADHCTTRR